MTAQKILEPGERVKGRKQGTRDMINTGSECVHRGQRFEGGNEPEETTMGKKRGVLRVGGGHSKSGKRVGKGREGGRRMDATDT